MDFDHQKPGFTVTIKQMHVTIKHWDFTINMKLSTWQNQF
jgi:hypothetical protein